MAEANYHGQTWSGLPLYICLLCFHNAFDMDRMTAHLLTIHAAEPIASIEEGVQAVGVAAEASSDAVLSAGGTLT